MYLKYTSHDVGIYLLRPTNQFWSSRMKCISRDERERSWLCEPWSKLVVRGSYRGCVGSSLTGYWAVYKKALTVAHAVLHPSASCLGSLYEETHYFGSILGTPDFGKLPRGFADHQPKSGTMKEVDKHLIVI